MHDSGKRRIVIVDDEHCVADTVAIILFKAGYEAAAYYDGRSALEACRTCAPDLLISDVDMPGINGVELAILMEQRCPQCKVVLFTGQGSSFELVEQAKTRGHVLEIVGKPIQPFLLLQKVASALAGGPSSPSSAPGL